LPVGGAGFAPVYVYAADVDLTLIKGREILAPVNVKVKRTYNLSESTIRRVRELAGKYEVAKSQDAVVELAVDRIYAEMRDREEAGLWAGAAEDPEFRAEMSGIAADFGDKDAWPR
jgi:hypothetical protein